MRQRTDTLTPPRSAPAEAGAPLPISLGPSRLSDLFGGMAQKDIAGILDCHESYVSLLERGKRIPSLAFAQKIAEAAHRPLNEVMAIFVA